MQNVLKKILSVFLCSLIVLSCLNTAVFTGLETVFTQIAEAAAAGPVPGDINGDGAVNNKDLTRLMKYLAGEDVEVVTTCLDTNGDSNINNKDLTRLMKYLSGEDVEIHPMGCIHQLKSIAAVAATCTANGNIAYWQCTACNELFSDENGTQSITAEDTVVEATGHTEEIIPAVAPTYDSYGSTEGVKCSVCDYVISEPKPVVPLEKDEIYVEYDVRGNLSSDSYLKKEIAKLVADGNSIHVNPNTINTTENSYSLRSIPIDTVPGYNFLGWYDGPNADAKRVTTIPKGETGYLELFAHWKLEEYEVIFDSPDVPVESITFTVNKSVQLKNIELQGYTFVGWSVNDVIINPTDGSVFSDNGKIITEIPVGTAKDVVVHANWTSNRNLMRPVKQLEDPLFIEDMDNEQLIFVYKIGTVENVPLFTVADLPNSAGLIWEIESDITKSMESKTAENLSETVSNATSITAGWTLSEDWNEVITATEENGSENGKTQGKINETGTVTGQQWYVSNSSGGAFTTSSSTGGTNSSSNKITDNNSWGLESAKKTEISGEKSNTHSVELQSSATKTQTETFDWKLGGNIGGSKEASLGANLGVEEKGVGSAGVSAGAKSGRTWNVNGEISGSREDTFSTTVSGGVANSSTVSIAASRANSTTTTANKTIGTELNKVSENNYNIGDTSSSTWNSTSGYETSETVSKNETISDTISELVYNKYGISSSKSLGGTDVQTETTGRTSENQKQYSSTVEYSTSEITTVKQKLTNNGSGQGYYRVVQAATAHVFAVVGFDIATQSFYTSTHTIVDKESAKIFIDHSRKSSNFNDCENGVLEFEIPFDLYKFTTRAMMRSEGLVINYDTGIVEKYEGDGGNIVIPEYASYYNEKTKRFHAVKITGISSEAFSGNETITGIILPDYVTEIPDNAFDGCVNLESFVSYGVTKIGNFAFRNCTALTHYSVDRFVTELGNNAFENVSSIDVVAANKNVVDAAIKSGAKNISIDISFVNESLDNMKIEIGAIDSFKFLSNAPKEYSNLQFVSDANESVFENIVLKNNADTPIILSSSKVSLNSVSVLDAPGFALILKNDNIELIVDGTNKLSTKGENAIISKNVNVTDISGSVGKLEVIGNYLVCGSIKNNDLIKVSSGTYKEISEDEYNSYLSSSVITFDSNNGTLSEDQKTKVVYYGQLYGELPVPARENYTFLGWFTAAEGGNKVTADSAVQSLVNQTLYAQWSPNKFVLNYNANGGNVSPANKELTYGDSYGSLPTPQRDYHNFVGWYTAAEGGTRVSESTTPSSASDVTIYAHWELKPVSSWVVETNMPGDAQLVSQKWTYIKRNYKESTNTSENGWVRYDDYWVESGSGSFNYASFPAGFDTGNWYYQNWNRGPVSSYTNETTRRDVSTWWSGYIYWHWMYDTGWANGIENRAIWNQSGYCNVNGYNYKYFGAFDSSTDYPYGGVYYTNNLGMANYIVSDRTSWDACQGAKRWFRFDYYTCAYTEYYKMFKYYQDVDCESSSYPSESDIRDIYRWVKYRAK